MLKPTLIVGEKLQCRNEWGSEVVPRAAAQTTRPLFMRLCVHGGSEAQAIAVWMCGSPLNVAIIKGLAAGDCLVARPLGHRCHLLIYTRAVFRPQKINIYNAIPAVWRWPALSSGGCCAFRRGLA